ncbi:zf-TFIIB domain-containing protein [Rhodoglobus vestalii]
MLDDLHTPNCERCLLRMNAIERNGVVVWQCPQCGLVRL